MLHSKHLLKCLGYAALFCSVIGANAAQEKGATQSSPSVGDTTTPSSDAAQFEVAPGMPLPAKGIVWILDQGENKPALVRIYLNSATANMHRGSNFARAQLFLKEVSTLELSEAAARQRINIHSPIIFVRKTMEDEEMLLSVANGKSVPAVHYVLLRMPVVNDRRVLCEFSIGAVAGKPARREDDVEVSLGEVAAGEWLQITPKQPLPDGEYALVRMPDDKTEAESFAYDFGIGRVARQPTKH